MIGGLVKPKPPVYKPRPVPKPSDCVGSGPCASGHFARDPNSSYNIRLMQYFQRKLEYDNIIIEELKQKLTGERITAKYITHSEMKGFKRTLNEKISNKMKEYDIKIEERRKRLTEILWKDERDLTREVVVNAQKGQQLRDMEKIEKLNKIKERKELERLEVVKEKRKQQYMLRCSEFRPVLANQRLIETKQAQLIQIQENESKRKSEEELEYFWHEMKMKYCAAIDEREENDRRKREKQKNEFLYYGDLQAKEKMAQNEMRRQERLDDAARLRQLRKDIEEEERAFLEKKRMKKNELLRMFNDQMKQRDEMLTRIADQENQIQRAYDELADIELARDIQREKDKVSTDYQDMIQYKQYLEELRQQKEEEDYRLNEIIEKDKREIESKVDKKRCQAQIDIQNMQDSVVEGRRQQIEERRKRDEQLQKDNEREEQLNKESREHNDRLQVEYDVNKFIKEKNYVKMLHEQIAYNKVIEDREKANMQKILDAAKIENQIYDNILAASLNGDIKISETHPFRRVIQAEKCPCPKPNY